MKRTIKLFPIIFCAALLLSCSEDYACLHCEEDFFENAAYYSEPADYSKKIVGDKMWMAENLKKGGCFELSKQYDWHCAHFGRLYSRNEVANACTGDWKLPTYEEFLEYLNNGGEVDLPGYWNGKEIEGIGSYGVWFVAEGKIIQISGTQIDDFADAYSTVNMYNIRCIGNY